MNESSTKEYEVYGDWGRLAVVKATSEIIDGRKGDTEMALRGRFSVSGDDVDCFVEEFEALILKYKI